MKITFLLSALTILLPSALFAQDRADLARQLETKEKELAELTEQVAEIDQQAKSSGFVKAKLERFRNAVNDAMLREAPEMEEAIKRQNVLVEEITRGQLSERAHEEKMAEYRELRAKIAPVEQQVNDDAAVVEARQTYVDAVDSERTKIKSNAEELFARQKELAAEVKELKAQLGQG